MKLKSIFADQNQNNAMNITNNSDLQDAFEKKISTVYIKDETIGNTFLVVSKVQCGHLPVSILKRIDINGTCKISVGEGVVVPVTKVLANEVLELNEMLEEKEIEIDIEDVHNIKVNLYYSS